MALRDKLEILERKEKSTHQLTYVYGLDKLIKTHISTVAKHELSRKGLMVHTSPLMDFPNMGLMSSIMFCLDPTFRLGSKRVK